MNKWRRLKSDLLFIWQFSLDDFKNKYSSSFLGVAWGIIQPLTTILVYWFVFQLGFKSQPVENFPFILWLVAGIIPWFFISETIPSATAVLSEYNYLVQKVLFNINILPLVKVVSAFLVHLFLIFITVVMFWLFGYPPAFSYIQVFYYAAFMAVLVAGISYFTAALHVFLKDLQQIIGIILQVLFWFTPIVWDVRSMSEGIQNVTQFNPIYFIVRGYRKTFIHGEAFWRDEPLSLFYWLFALLLLFAGMALFRKLKPHFADVL